ncbi:lactoylglutathione lyase [Gammaproteobacteria bacterium 45_16_T64]|nr:lactoylglutathione lyase [Gammaproteobacteria bacterium 45_16_T64]
MAQNILGDKSFGYTKRRMLHTMLRVGDLEKSIHFYRDVLGMTLIRIFDNSNAEYTLAFLGYAEEESTCVLELTYNYGTTAYDMGNAYGHIAIGVDDCYSVCEDIKLLGGEVVREAGPLKGGEDIIAFVVDPNGYKIELIQCADEWFF